MTPNVLQVDCVKCRVAEKCPRKGASPTVVNGKRLLCGLIGGYGRVPLSPSVMSEESRARSTVDGPCLTLAQVPTVKDGSVEYELVKIFSPPVLHDRETVPWQTAMIAPPAGAK
jgi:hypothetical protein